MMTVAYCLAESPRHNAQLLSMGSITFAYGILRAQRDKRDSAEAEAHAKRQERRIECRGCLACLSEGIGNCKPTIIAEVRSMTDCDQDAGRPAWGWFFLRRVQQTEK